MPSWVSVDAQVSYEPARWARIGVQARNLLDSRGRLVKTGDFPFDYRIEPLEVLGFVDLTL